MIKNTTPNLASGQIIDFQVGDWLWEENSSRANPRLITKLWIHSSSKKLQYETDINNTKGNIGYITIRSRRADALEIVSARKRYPQLIETEKKLKNMKTPQLRYRSKVSILHHPIGTEFTNTHGLKNEVMGTDPKDLYAPKGHWLPLFLNTQMTNSAYFELIPEETEEEKNRKLIGKLDSILADFDNL